MENATTATEPLRKDTPKTAIMAAVARIFLFVKSQSCEKSTGTIVLFD